MKKLIIVSVLVLSGCATFEDTRTPAERQADAQEAAVLMGIGSQLLQNSRQFYPQQRAQCYQQGTFINCDRF